MKSFRELAQTHEPCGPGFDAMFKETRGASKRRNNMRYSLYTTIEDIRPQGGAYICSQREQKKWTTHIQFHKRPHCLYSWQSQSINILLLSHGPFQFQPESSTGETCHGWRTVTPVSGILLVILHLENFAERPHKRRFFRNWTESGRRTDSCMY